LIRVQAFYGKHFRGERISKYAGFVNQKCGWFTRQKTLNQPIEYRLKSTLLGLNGLLQITGRKRWKVGLQVPPTKSEDNTISEVDDYGDESEQCVTLWANSKTLFASKFPP
jgi:hypothetical protein